MIIKPPVEDVFLKTGNLSLAEFLRAGDELISNCNSWGWKYASSTKNQNNLLPPEK